MNGGGYVVSGVPIVIDGVSRALKDALLVLLAVAVGVMALALLLVFRSRFRLLPLLLALAAAALTFGLFGVFGGSLTMASIAVLPILIGLAVDYAIQFQARGGRRSKKGPGGRRRCAVGGCRRGPTTAPPASPPSGISVPLLSPTPMVRGFGLLLVVGIAIGFALTVTAGFAALSLRREVGRRVPLRGLGFSPRAQVLSPSGLCEKQDAARFLGTHHSHPF